MAEVVAKAESGPSSPIQLPQGRGWIYFAVMAMAAALFGGFVYWLLHHHDPIGKVMGMSLI